MKKCAIPFGDINKHVKWMIMVLVFLLFTGFATAQTAKDTAGREKPASVKHIATREEGVYFQVQLSNESSEKFLLTIQDNDGRLLFRETYQDKAFDKKFLFSKEDMDESLTFTIRKLKDNEIQVFQISYTAHSAEDVVITRVK